MLNDLSVFEAFLTSLLNSPFHSSSNISNSETYCVCYPKKIHTVGQILGLAEWRRCIHDDGITYFLKFNKVLLLESLSDSCIQTSWNLLILLTRTKLLKIERNESTEFPRSPLGTFLDTSKILAFTMKHWPFKALLSLDGTQPYLRSFLRNRRIRWCITIYHVDPADGIMQIIRQRYDRNDNRVFKFLLLPTPFAGLAGCLETIAC